MLVHIPTMGVLNYIYEGKETSILISGSLKILPQYTKTSFETIEGLNKEEWQEIPSNSSLGQRLLRSYPFVTPVLNDEGKLVDIIMNRQEKNQKIENKKQEMKRKREEKKKEAKEKGYMQGGRSRPVGMFDFLKKD